MIDFTKRDFIAHAQGLFNKQKLLNIMEKFDLIDESKQELDALSERDKHSLHLGVATDKMRMQECWYDIWCACGQEMAKLIDVIGPFRYVTYPVQLRKLEKSNHKVPWHQDVGYMRLLPISHEQVITCFVPLEENPAQSTTLLFLPTRAQQELKHEAKDGFGAGIYIENEEGRDTTYFNLALGDALVFGDHAIHKTYTPDDCRFERRSLEFRLIKPEHAIAGKDYFDIDSQRFIKIED